MILVPVILLIAYLPIKTQIGWGVLEASIGIPVIMLLMDLVFIIASITDKLDGYLARSRNMVTTFGKFLDPLADKILVLVSLMILVQFDKLPAWVPAIILIREFLVSGYRLVAIEKGGKVIAASFWGKLKTVFQMIAIILAFIDIHEFGEFIWNGFAMTKLGFIVNIINTIFMGLSVIATIFSGYDYLKNSKELFKD
jgi:CDP-diacylglycerol--glycerol-3-phosphate 3-phosphatidyltransferase